MNFQAHLETMQKLRAFQKIYRLTQKDIGVHESDAEHSWNLAMNLLIMLPELEKEFGNLEHAKLLKMALIHDLGEIGTGDKPTWEHTDQQAKEEAERNAMTTLLETAPQQTRDELMQLW